MTRYLDVIFCLNIHLSILTVHNSSLSCLSALVLSYYPVLFSVSGLLPFFHSAVSLHLSVAHTVVSVRVQLNRHSTPERQRETLSLSRCLFNSCRTAITRSLFAGTHLLLNLAFYFCTVMTIWKASVRKQLYEH